MNFAVTAWQFKVFGTPARIAYPVVLWALVGVVFIGLLWIRLLYRRHRDLTKIAPTRLLAKMAPRAGIAREVVSSSFAFAGLTLVLIAGAQPECGSRTIRAKRHGMDVVIAIDASTSMLAQDVKPSRIARAKLELSGLVDRLKGDRVGIVAFAGDAFVQCPLTTDYSAAKLFLKAVNPREMPHQGTALAEALATSATLFEGADPGTGHAAGKSVVVLTDGEDHEGAVDEEAKKLAEAGIKIFSIGVGSLTPELIPEYDGRDNFVGYKKDSAGRPITSKLNEEGLKSIADVTGGKYVHSSFGDLGVGEVIEELNRMDKADFEDRVTVEYDQRFEYFAWPGAVLLAASWVLGEGRFRRRREAPV